MGRASRSPPSSCACSPRALRCRATAPSSASPWRARRVSASCGSSRWAITRCASSSPTATTPGFMSGSICASSASTRRSAGRAISPTSLPSASRASSGLRLFGEEGALALDAATIPGQRSIGSYDAVARNRDGDAVRAAGPRHGPRCFWRADGLRNFCIAGRRAHGDAAERLPHAMLKGGPADVEGKVETDAWVLDKTDHFGGKLLERGIVTGQARARKLLLEVARKTLWIVAEENGAYALLARRDQHQAERAFSNREIDLRIGTA